MLDPWIIEEIIRREREEQERQRQQPRIEVPMQRPDRDPVPSSAPSEQDKDCGVTVIDI